MPSRTASSTSAIRSSSTMSSLPGRWPTRGFDLWVTPSAQVVHAAHSSTRMLGPRREAPVSRLARSHALARRSRRAKVWLYRTVVLREHSRSASSAVRTHFGLAELWKALSGDAGPLPADPFTLDEASAPQRPMVTKVLAKARERGCRSRFDLAARSFRPESQGSPTVGDTPSSFCRRLWITAERR